MKLWENKCVLKHTPHFCKVMWNIYYCRCGIITSINIANKNMVFKKWLALNIVGYKKHVSLKLFLSNHDFIQFWCSHLMSCVLSRRTLLLSTMTLHKQYCGEISPEIYFRENQALCVIVMGAGFSFIFSCLGLSCIQLQDSLPG